VCAHHVSKEAPGPSIGDKDWGHRTAKEKRTSSAASAAAATCRGSRPARASCLVQGSGPAIREEFDDGQRRPGLDGVVQREVASYAVIAVAGGGGALAQRPGPHGPRVWRTTSSDAPHRDSVGKGKQHALVGGGPDADRFGPRIREEFHHIVVRRASDRAVKGQQTIAGRFPHRPRPLLDEVLHFVHGSVPVPGRGMNRKGPVVVARPFMDGGRPLLHEVYREQQQLISPKRAARSAEEKPAVTPAAFLDGFRATAPKDLYHEYIRAVLQSDAERELRYPESCIRRPRAAAATTRGRPSSGSNPASGSPPRAGQSGTIPLDGALISGR
jgi:hypothetical protein